MNRLVLATRRSPLALVQAGLAAAHLREALGIETQLLPIVTTGDRRTDWSLEARGGKGLFTGELEESLRRGEADIAVHSTKDLPGEPSPDLEIAGYLPRANPRDVLIVREGISHARRLATDSPRRRLQLAMLFASVEFMGIRGNVDTRLKKIAEGEADGTVLAAAGLQRLGIAGWPGLQFQPLEFSQMVPAVGQGAIALQCRGADVPRYRAHLDGGTARTVGVERALQEALGGGCHTAFGAHATRDTLYLFHEACGLRSVPLAAEDLDAPARTAGRLLKQLQLA